MPSGLSVNSVEWSENEPWEWPGIKSWAERYRLSREDIADIWGEVREKFAALSLSEDLVAEFQARGFRVEYRSLCVGLAVVYSRLEYQDRAVYLDEEALFRLARVAGKNLAEVRAWALAHELGHLVLSHLRGARAELAAHLFATCYIGEPTFMGNI